MTTLPVDSDLSLVDGGPAYRAMLRLGLAPPAPARVARRVAFFAALTWPPLLILSAAGGRVLGGEVAIPFLKDFVAHVRFLAALPLLVVAEPLVGVALANVARQFVDSQIVVEPELRTFRRAGAAVLRLRDSVTAEVALLILAYLGAVASIGTQLGSRLTSWGAAESGSPAGLTAAGWWYVLISMPLFRFLVLRWAYRFGLWAMLLWKVSRLRLQLSAIHPDRAGGLGFLAAAPAAFSPIAFALGCVVSAVAARRIAQAEVGLLSTQMAVGAFIVLATVVPILPLLAFTPKLVRVRWRGIMRLGRLGEEYAQAFDEKWTDRPRETADELLGTADIQSLADLNNSFEVARRSRFIPIGVGSVLGLAVSAAAPMAPLLLLFYPVKEIVKMLLGVLL